MISRLRRLIPERHPLRLLWHRSRGQLAAAWYAWPSRKIRSIAITGTDGKTTTVAMTAHVLRKTGKSVGAVSSTFFQINDRQWSNPTHKTSLDPFIFQKFLKQCLDAGCEFVVVEASSHGLVQGRLGPFQPEVAAITNTSLEHLDYHGTMEQYRSDKGILFKMLGGKGTKVLNASDATHPLYMQIPSTHTLSYTSSAHQGTADFSASEIVTTPTQTSARIHWNNSQAHLELPIPGAFNIENALCAIACVAAIGVSADQSVNALQTFQGVPGRLERIAEGQPFHVFVDFTVSPLAYEKNSWNRA